MRLSARLKSFRTQPVPEGGAGETMRDTRRHRTRAHIRCTLQSTDLWEYFVTYSTSNHPRLATGGPSGRASACARGYGGTGRRRGDCNCDVMPPFAAAHGYAIVCSCCELLTMRRVPST